MPDENTRSKRKGFFLICLLFIVLLVGGVYAMGGIATNTVTVNVTANQTRSELGAQLSEPLSWTDEDRAEFESTFAQMQWAAWNGYLRDIFKERFGWTQTQEEDFLISSSLQFSGPELDVLSGVYEPGTYVIDPKSTKAEIAGAFIDRVTSTHGSSTREFIASHVHESAALNIDAFVRSARELLPDLVPAPAEDLKIEKLNGDTVLRFSTIYYNQGKGPLELIADPKTKGIRSDIERKVFQRIQSEDGSVRDHESGTFLWHQEHLHYHFADFILYDLEAIRTDSPAPDLSGVKTKSTFCIRDISRTDQDLENRAADAAFKICGKEKQGISVGWGDSYFYNYPDQLLNITDLPSGEYRLSFVVNPEKLFEESRYDNNKSSVVFKLDMNKKTITPLSQDPVVSPKLEHIYLEQDL